MATMVTANGNRGMPESTLWTAADLSSLALTSDSTIPAFTLDETARVPGFDLWDMWPVERADGSCPASMAPRCGWC
jgi:levansucrase